MASDSGGNKRSDVEIPEQAPDEAGVQDSTLGIALKGIRIKAIFLTICGAIALFLLILVVFHLHKEGVRRSVPKIERVVILSRVEGEDFASDEPKIVKDGRGVMLYLVAYGYDETRDQHYYYTKVADDFWPRFVIDGEEIASERIRPFDFYDTDGAISWLKIEARDTNYRDVSKPMPERLFWTESNVHFMGNNWWAIADVRPDIIQFYHFDFVGTMRFVAKLQIYNTNDVYEVFQKIYSTGARPARPGELPPGGHRITIWGEGASELERAYRGFFNILAYEGGYKGESAAELTEMFAGGNSRSILIGALRQLGRDVSYDDTDFLERVAERVYEDLFVDEFLYFRKTEAPDEYIPYGSEGVRPGDIIVRGDRYAILIGNEQSGDEPEGGALTGDDLILDAYNKMVGPDFCHVFQDGEEPIEVWRLRSSPGGE